MWGYRVYRNRLSDKNYCPHACGGVPKWKMFIDWEEILSPRMWGCTIAFLFPILKHRIVPTHVGVYRGMFNSFSSSSHCPHACGGVPNGLYDNFDDLELSPRMWGCTETSETKPDGSEIVPTYVGVYRLESR